MVRRRRSAAKVRFQPCIVSSFRPNVTGVSEYARIQRVRRALRRGASSSRSSCLVSVGLALTIASTTRAAHARLLNRCALSRPVKHNVMPQRNAAMKSTNYFKTIRARPDRAITKDEWILYVVENPEREYIQADGRIRRWAAIDEMENRYLRVIVLPDRETIHNAFFDRGYKP